MRVHHQQFDKFGAACFHRRAMTTMGFNTRIMKAGKLRKGWIILWSPGYIDLPSI